MAGSPSEAAAAIAASGAGSAAAIEARVEAGAQADEGVALARTVDRRKGGPGLFEIGPRLDLIVRRGQIVGRAERQPRLECEAFGARLFEKVARRMGAGKSSPWRVGEGGALGGSRRDAGAQRRFLAGLRCYGNDQPRPRGTRGLPPYMPSLIASDPYTTHARFHHRRQFAARAEATRTANETIDCSIEQIKAARQSKTSGGPGQLARSDRRRPRRQNQFERFYLLRLNIADGLPIARSDASRNGSNSAGLTSLSFKSWAACKPKPAPVRCPRCFGRNEACGCRTNRRRQLRADSAARRLPARAAP